MSFDVVPAEIRANAGIYRDLASDTDVAQSYVDTHIDLPQQAEGEIFPLVRSNVIGLKLDLRDALNRIDHLLYNANLELHNVARLYEDTDHAQSERYDRQYDQVGPPPERYADTAPPVEDTVPEDTE